MAGTGRFRNQLSTEPYRRPPTNDEKTRSWDDAAGKVVAYTTLQLLVGIIALALPLVLFVGHYFLPGHHMPGSMSAFYYTRFHAYFAGTLCALGVFLVAYKYAPRDNRLSTFAGVLVIVVALCPTAPEGQPLRPANYVHLGSALVFFLLLGYFSVWLFTKSHPGKAPLKQKRRRNRIYRVCGILIFAADAAAAVLAKSSVHLLFVWETVAVVAFGISWLVKALGGKGKLPKWLTDDDEPVPTESAADPAGDREQGSDADSLDALGGRDDLLRLQRGCRDLRDSLLGVMAAKQGVFWRQEADPELLRILGRIYGDLGDIERLIDEHMTPGTTGRLLRLVTRDLNKSTQPLEAWEVSDSIRLELIDIATDEQLGRLFEAELNRLTSPYHVSPGWTAFFSRGELDKYVDAFRAGEPRRGIRRMARSSLHELYERRSDTGRLLRARQGMRAMYFRDWFRELLVLLVLTIAIGSVAASVPRWSTNLDMVFAAIAGAAGSTLSGVYQFRRLDLIAEMRSFQTGLLIQPLLGALGGTFLYLVIASDVIRLPGITTSNASWAVIGLYAFLAGFSEPFFLGTIRRIVGSDGSGPSAEEG